MEDHLLECSPARQLTLPKLPQGDPPKNISDDDLARMLQAAFNSGPRDYAIIRFLADTSCRVGGLVGLSINDVNLAGEAIVREKGRKTRSVFFGQTTALALQAYLIIRPRTGGSAFWWGQKGPLKREGVHQLLHRLGERAGCEGPYNAHAFRHAWARRALLNGMGLDRVSQLLGHADIGVTHRHYACWTTRELKASHQKYDTMVHFDIMKGTAF